MIRERLARDLMNVGLPVLYDFRHVEVLNGELVVVEAKISPRRLEVGFA